jgi:hypothetical protein
MRGTKLVQRNYYLMRDRGFALLLGGMLLIAAVGIYVAWTLGSNSAARVLPPTATGSIPAGPN